MAAEVFTNKTYPLYEQQALALLEKHPELDPALAPSLRNKFDRLGHVLAPESAAIDSSQFAMAKRLRDRILHGEFVPEQELPTEAICRVVRKYLACHLDREIARS